MTTRQRKKCILRGRDNDPSRELVDVPGSPCRITRKQAGVVQAARDLVAANQPPTARAIAIRVGLNTDAVRTIAHRLKALGVEDFEIAACRSGPGSETNGVRSNAELAERIAAARREVERRRALGTLTPDWYRGPESIGGFQ